MKLILGLVIGYSIHLVLTMLSTPEPVERVVVQYVTVPSTDWYPPYLPRWTN